MGETFSKVNENREIADSFELIEMIIEAETLLFWRRNLGVKKYLQICMVEEDLEDEIDEETQKLRNLKAQVLSLDEKIEKNFNTNLETTDMIINNLKRFQEGNNN